MCGKDARIFCDEFGGDHFKRTADDCAAIEKERRADVVHVYFCTSQTCRADATPKEIDQVRVQLKSNPQVESLRFVPKEAAFAEMKRKYPDLAKKVKENPLPDALTVTARPGDGRAIAATLRPPPAGVERVTFTKG
jgi:cell division protein FtsX